MEVSVYLLTFISFGILIFVFLGELYTALYRDFISRSDIYDFTGNLLNMIILYTWKLIIQNWKNLVEDPNDSFVDLRDKCDVRHLIQAGVFAGVSAPVDQSEITKVKERYKLSKVIHYF